MNLTAEKPIQTRCPGDDSLLGQFGQFSPQGPRGEIALIAAQCRQCKKRMFPPRERCVACFGSDLSSCHLPRKAEVVTFTVVRQAPAGYNGAVPYVLGQVRIDGEITVLSHLVGKPLEQWRPGDQVASYVLEINDKAGKPTAFHSFRPATPADLT